jgi:hypothetical protein
MWNTASAKTIILAGDSWLNPGWNHGVNEQIHRLTGADIINVSVGGRKSWELLDQLNAAIAGGWRPASDTTMIVDIGLPDWWINTPPAEVYADIDQFLTTLRYLNVKVLLSGSPEAHNESEIPLHFPMSPIFHWLKQNHPEITLIDAMSVLNPIAELHSGDQIHLNSQGYYIYNLWLSTIYNQSR